jgi:outer membrane protein TolC
VVAACTLQKLRFVLAVVAMLSLSRMAVAASPPYRPSTSPAPPAPRATREGSREEVPAPQPASFPTAPRGFLEAPVLDPNADAPGVPSVAPATTDRPLPINLATALHLSNVRPLAIAFAQNGVEAAAARLDRANVLWLPNFNTGVEYYRHDGADQTTQGDVITVSKSYLAAGAGATLRFELSDAVFQPLAARQQLAAQQYELQAARNDSLATVATVYFDVQEARGRLAGNIDAKTKAEDLAKRVEVLARGLVPEIEVDRARALLLDLEQEIAASHAAWQTNSARLTRVLRLNPGTVVVPLEPPQLQVTLISPGQIVDDLIPIGLKNRPELASQRALVSATLELLRQERLRPLIPSLVLQGRSGPGGAFNGAVFEGSRNDNSYQGGGRFDGEVGVVWTLANLGAGNRALVRERAAQEQRAMLDLFNIQDRIAEEVVQAHAQIEATAVQVVKAETGLQEAQISFAGTLKGISEPRGPGQPLVNRPQEAVAALQQLNRAYNNYFASINAFNRAQFQLYRAVGYPARGLVCDRPVGEVQNVDTTRPPGMAPVCPHVLSRPCP